MFLQKVFDENDSGKGTNTIHDHDKKISASLILSNPIQNKFAIGT
jgi:hypothetical protein